MTTMDSGESSYIDYEIFKDAAFSPVEFANSLVLATNNPSDNPIDITTPLSRVLFDIEEVDKHLHTLSTQNALPLLTFTRSQNDAGQKIVEEVGGQVDSLGDGYRRLEREVIQRYETAQQVQQTVERLWQTVKIGQAVTRCLLLGRQLEAQMAEVGTSVTSTGASTPASARREDHLAMVRAARTLVNLRELVTSSPETAQLKGIHLISNLQSGLLARSQSSIQTRAAQIIREFSLSSLTSSSLAGNTNAASTTEGLSYAQSEETKARTTSALLTLHLISPALQLGALEAYLRTALTSSLASIARSLSGNLPNLERTLVEVSARCQNIVALESLLQITYPISHGGDQEKEQRHETPNDLEKQDSDDDNSEPTDQPPTTEPTDDTPTSTPNFLTPLLTALDTASLPSYFWRSLAEGLGGRVSDLIQRGGAPARALRGQKERVREALRDCVVRGSQGPGLRMKKGAGREGGPTYSWEREAAVMVGSVVGPLGR